jgi:hypothetical protein
MTDRPFIGDVHRLVEASPYLQLAKRRSAEGFLRRGVSLAEECFTALADYPRVLVEPLEFFYTCLRSLGALTPLLLEVLVRDCTWRGAVWGAWLAILEPRPEFLPALESVRRTYPHNDWLIECALTAVRAESPSPEQEAILGLGARCRELLRDVKRPVTPLRRAPTDVEVAQMDREREVVRAAYARGGAEAARAAFSGTLVRYYSENYSKWAARGRAWVNPG